MNRRWRSELLPCLCWSRDLSDDLIVEYRMETGVLWAVYQTCPQHGIQAIQPVPGVGVLKNEPATARTVPVELEA